MKKRKKIIIALLVLSVFIITVGMISSNPFLSYKCDVPEEYVQKISAQARGIYSNRLPLLPIYVSIESFSGKQVYYTIHYFPFGTVGMSYSQTDGYNMEKPLTGL